MTKCLHGMEKGSCDFHPELLQDLIECASQIRGYLIALDELGFPEATSDEVAFAMSAILIGAKNNAATLERDLQQLRAPYNS